VLKGIIELTLLGNNVVINQKGVIQVLDGVDYRCVYQNFIDGRWIPVKNPLKPVV